MLRPAPVPRAVILVLHSYCISEKYAYPEEPLVWVTWQHSLSPYSRWYVPVDSIARARSIGWVLSGCGWLSPSVETSIPVMSSSNPIVETSDTIAYHILT